MRFSFYVSFILIIYLSSCTRYSGDFSKLEFKDFENINHFNKVEKKIILYQGFKTTELNTRVKYRGGSSFGYKKKNFTINLAEEYKFKGLKKDDDWILHASVVDKTFLRNVFCYKYYQKWNKENEAPQTKYAELFVDNEYYGFYVLTERLDISSLNLNRKDALLYKEPAVFRPFSEKLDSISKATGNYYHQKHPKDIERSEIIDSLKNFILYSSDSLFEQNVFEIFDKQNIIDWHLILELTNNADGLQKNFFFYQKKSKGKFRMALWDCDHSLGRDGDNEYNMLDREIDMKENILISRLLKNKNIGYNSMLRKRWKKLRETKKISVKKMTVFIDTEANKIKPFVDRNFNKWPLTGWPYHDSNTFEQEVDILKKYLKICIPQLDSKYKYKPN